MDIGIIIGITLFLLVIYGAYKIRLLKKEKPKINKECEHKVGWCVRIKMFWWFTRYVFVCSDCGDVNYFPMHKDFPKLTIKIDGSRKRIIVNRIKTPDGTILTSHSVHDYKTHEDANGKEYMVDGGHDYLRRTVWQDAPFEELSVYEDEPFEMIRLVLTWGTYGKTGDQPLTFVALYTMSDDHIRAIIRQKQGAGWFRDFMKKELIYRIENDIVVRDPDPASVE